ncbi:MAG TPA: hypothetical protein VF576_10640 [Rubricoccaceae bacterium]|jgi:hypothetical protein
MTHASRAGRALALAAAVLALAAPASAQQYTQQVTRQLDGARATLQREGYRQTHDYEIGNLNDDAEESFTVNLTGDRNYAVVGACDSDCSDMDFWLYDENENLIDSDTGTDDVPVVRVTPSWTGQFTVRVKMYACSANPCYYGIGVFGD